MKRTYELLLIILLALFGLHGIVSAQITIIGGASDVNGTYNNTFSYMGKPAYERSSGVSRDILWRSDAMEWRITTGSGTGRYYYNTANTATPPDVGWQIGGDGIAPAPVAGVDVTSLLVGDGSSGSPYEISSLNSLYWIAQNTVSWSKCFKQTANIDASETATWFGGAGWTPIGNSVNGFFSGKYDGNTHTINSLHINRTADYQGLFGGFTAGSLGASGGIYDLGLTNVDITATAYSGAIVGEIYYVTVNNCYSTGSITTTGTGYGGGLIGYAYSTLIRNSYSECTVSCTGGSYAGSIAASAELSTIKNCRSTGSVQGINYIGGIVGSLYNQSIIQDCFSTSSVTGTGFAVGGLVGSIQINSSAYRNYSHNTVTGYRIVGGLIGYMNQGTIGDCYSRSDVTLDITQSNGGGIVGLSQNITIDKCFSTGTVTGGGYIGGVAGNTITSTVTASFWDTQTSGVAVSAGGTGKLTTEMKDRSTFNNAGWDDAVWFMEDGINDGYPYLAWQNPGGAPLPVELCSFRASIQDGSVQLFWKTMTEVNNYGFEVERKTIDNEQLRMENWRTIGFVEGSGSTNMPKEYFFTEKNVPQGSYSYRLKQIDRDGKFSYSNSVEAEITELKEFSLGQNYPNPFNPMTTIGYQLPISGHVTLKLYDMIGRETVTLVNETKAAGRYELPFDASSFAGGIYFYTIRVGTFSATKKLLLLK